MIKGLLIKKHWIDEILNGNKTWEIRGSNTKIRGKIALIQSSSGTVVGTCDLIDTTGPLTHAFLKANSEKHCIPIDDIDSLVNYKTPYAWIIDNAIRLTKP